MTKETTQKNDKNLETQQRQRGTETAKRHTLAPPVDIFENKEEYLLVADIPGVRPGDVHVSFQAGELTIRATRASAVPAVELVFGE